MRRTSLALAALAVSMSVAPSAHADGSDVIHGGCDFGTVHNSATGEDVGTISDRSVTTDASGAPIGATVTCWIEVDQAEAPGTRFSYSGTGVQAGANPISFVAGDGWVRVCQAVTYADGSTEPTSCPDPTVIQIPPQICEGCSLIDILLRALDDVLIDDVDPALCPVLAQHSGSYPGGITIAPDGDVYVPDPLVLFAGPVYDCPPYVPTP